MEQLEEGRAVLYASGVLCLLLGWEQAFLLNLSFAVTVHLTSFFWCEIHNHYTDRVGLVFYFFCFFLLFGLLAS